MRISSLLSRAGAAVALLVPVMASAVGIQVIIDGKTIVFVDVPQSAWFATYVHDAAEAGIVSGYKDSKGELTGKFGPENSVTMAESLKIVVEGSGYDNQLYGSMIDSGSTHWSASYISVAKSEKFATLEDITRNLNRPATRAQLASMIVSSFHVQTSDIQSPGNRFSDVKLVTTYAVDIEALARDGIVSGDIDSHGEALGTYRPMAQVNRAEVVKMVMSARLKYGQPGSDLRPSEESASAMTSDETSMVHFNGDGFSPQVLRITSGTTVTFRNDSGGKVQVASNAHPSHNDYPGFDAGSNGTPAGQDYKFTFTKKGTWGYHDHLNPQIGGTIIVE